MNAQEYVSLAPHTTFRIGGPARFFVEAHTERDIQNAVLHAQQHTLPLLVLGEGSNVLIPDDGVDGVVLKVAMRDIRVEERVESILFDAGAGALWEDIVDEACARRVFGIENLAGIPGSLGGAVVQNIGAYGAELSSVFVYADSIDRTTGATRRVTRAEAAFSYRTSFFKEHREYIITRVVLRFMKNAASNITYPDLVRAHTEGVPLSTPAEIARAVRVIRALKFPHGSEEGTAGSFFKNPVIARARFEELVQRFPGIPMFPQENDMVKLSLAWILDHVLSLKGFSLGNVRLYEKQPLVIVARPDARFAEVDALATLVAKRVFAATGITLEREVETFGVCK